VIVERPALERRILGSLDAGRIPVILGGCGTGRTSLLLRLEGLLGRDRSQYVDVAHAASTPERCLAAVRGAAHLPWPAGAPPTSPRGAFLALVDGFDRATAPDGRPVTWLLDEFADVRVFENFPGLRDVQRETVGRLAASPASFVLASRFTVSPFRFQPEPGLVSGFLPIVATRLEKDATRRYKGFRLNFEGRARVNEVEGYQYAFRAQLPREGKPDRIEQEGDGFQAEVGRAYERLSYDADVKDIDLGPYLQDVCADAISAASHCKLDFDAVQGIQLDADRAISLALIINELVTNAAKYAFSNRSDGHIWVRLVRQDENTALISVRDDGVGLPADFDLSKSRGLECASSRHFQNN
jgi:signal transduction histidine kinase